MDSKDYKRDTTLVHAGRHPEDYHGVVNPPISRTSTILYPSLAAYEDKNHRYRYGRLGNPLSDAFEKSIADLEGGYNAISTQSGAAAISTSLLSFLKAGDHLLMVDTVYPPTRDFCKNVLGRMGIETEFYDPMIGIGIEAMIRPNTAVIYMESPGSGTFEVMDVPAIARIARNKGVVTMIDNTWSAGILFNPIKHGVHVCLQSATKYIGGHSDINLGVVVAADEEIFQKLRQTSWDMGVCATAEDLYLALRGLRTLTTRMKQNAANARVVIDWMMGRPEIARVFYPALPDHKGHEIWKRDFSGGNGLFSFLLKPAPKQAVHDFVDSLKLTPIGSSWGGYESLCQPQYLKNCRTASPWIEEGALLRFQIGFEDPADLIADIENALRIFSRNI